MKHLFLAFLTSSIFLSSSCQRILSTSGSSDLSVNISVVANSNTNPVSFAVTFNHSVSSLSSSNLVVGNGVIASINGSAYNYTVDVTPSAPQVAVSLDLVAGSVVDSTGHTNKATTSAVVNYDSVKPSVVISSSVSSPTNLSLIPITFTFSENIMGFNESQIGVTNGVTSAGSLAGGSGVYTVNVLPNANATVAINLPANKLTDLAGNSNTAATQFNITSDTIVPTLTISSTAPANTNISPIPFTFTFSKSVTGFVVGDIQITNGTVVPNSLTGGPSLYTVNVTPSGNSVTVFVDVAASAAIDSAGNASTAAAQFSRVYLNSTPTVVISSSVGNPTNGSTIPLTFTFSTSMTGFTSGDVLLTNATVVGGSFAGGPTIYTMSVTPTGNGTVTVNVPANAAQDIASNGNSAATQYSTLYDTSSPTTTISSTAPPTLNVSPIPFSVTFNENVNNFVSTDINVTNGSISSFSGGPAIYTFNVTPAGQGAVTVNVAASVAQDNAGNNNLVAASYSRTYDSISPTTTISSNSSATTNVAPIPVTITFNENVLGFIATDIAVTNGTISAFAGGPAVYTFNLTPSGQGAVTINVAPGVAQDGSGNGNSVATQLSRTYDTVSPSVTISSTTAAPPTVINSSPIPVTFTFSESVTGFTAADISVVNGTVAGGIISGGPSVYTANITPTANFTGDVTVDVGAGLVDDPGNNGNSAAAQLVRKYDGSAPTVLISSSEPQPTSNTIFDVSVIFSEDVSGFVASDVSVTNGTVATIVANSNSDYTVSISATSLGLVSVMVNASVAQDAGGNNNTAAPAPLNRNYVACTVGTVTFDNNGPGTATVTHGALSVDADHIWENFGDQGGPSLTWNFGMIPSTLTLTSQCIEDVTGIIVGASNISTISSLQKLKRLSVLDLSNNQVSALAADQFIKNVLLQDLNLSQNLLTLISANQFSTNSSLKILNLGENQISSLAATQFTNNTALTSLNIAVNQLTTLDSSQFAALTNLQTLDISSNMLTALDPGTFANNPNLLTLRMGYNSFGSFDVNLFSQQPLLQVLDLSGAGLTTIDSQQFINNTELLEVWAPSNQVTAIDPAIFNANTKLKIIAFYNNEITSLDPLQFANNSELEFVDFTSNQLSMLDPNLLSGNPALTTASFATNSISSLSPTQFSNNPLLLSVNFVQNSLTTLDPNLFIANPNINQVSFGNNALPSSVVDNLVIDVSTHSTTSGGFINAQNQSPAAPRTSTSDSSYTNLIGRGWSLNLD